MGTEVELLIKEILAKNKNYVEKQIKFIPYCKIKMVDRGIEESLVIDTLLFKDSIYYVEKQESSFLTEPEIRYKQIYKISSKYSLIIIATYKESVLKHH